MNEKNIGTHNSVLKSLKFQNKNPTSFFFIDLSKTSSAVNFESLC